MKPSYILNMTYAMATVIARIHSPAVVMSAPRSMFLAVCDTGDLPKEGDDCSLENQMTIIKPENILHALATTSSNQPDISPVPDAPTLS
jgi:hypothetical protein